MLRERKEQMVEGVEVCAQGHPLALVRRTYRDDGRGPRQLLCVKVPRAALLSRSLVLTEVLHEGGEHTTFVYQLLVVMRDSGVELHHPDLWATGRGGGGEGEGEEGVLRAFYVRVDVCWRPAGCAQCSEEVRANAESVWRRAVGAEERGEPVPSWKDAPPSFDDSSDCDSRK